MRYDFTSADEAILRMLYVFPYMTAEQVCRALYSDGNITGVRKRLKKLAKLEELHRSPMFSDIQSGKNPMVYWLKTKGRNRLKTLGYGFDSWPFASEMQPFLKSSHFPHYMATTDFLIAVSTTPDLQIPGLFADFAIKRERYADVLPDGWVHIIHKGFPVYLLIEVDMGTEKEKVFKEKIYALVNFLMDGSYHHVYQTAHPLLLFWTPKGDERRDKMLLWIEQQLQSMYEVNKVKWFRVSSCQLSPDMLFGNEWFIPNCTGARTLTSVLI